MGIGFKDTVVKENSCAITLTYLPHLMSQLLCELIEFNGYLFVLLDRPKRLVHRTTIGLASGRVV